MYWWNDGGNFSELGHLERLINLVKTTWKQDVSVKWNMFVLSDFLFLCARREISWEHDSSAGAELSVSKEWGSREGFWCQWNLPCCCLLFTLPPKENNCFNSHLIKFLLLFGDSIKFWALLLVAEEPSPLESFPVTYCFSCLQGGRYRLTWKGL